MTFLEKTMSQFEEMFAVKRPEKVKEVRRFIVVPGMVTVMRDGKAVRRPVTPACLFHRYGLNNRDKSIPVVILRNGRIGKFGSFDRVTKDYRPLPGDVMLRPDYT